MASKGAGGAKCKLSQVQLAELEAVLDEGPACCGYEDRCWTLARITDLVWQRFGVQYTPCGSARAAVQVTAVLPWEGLTGWFDEDMLVRRITELLAAVTDGHLEISEEELAALPLLPTTRPATARRHHGNAWPVSIRLTRS